MSVLGVSAPVNSDGSALNVEIAVLNNKKSADKIFWGDFASLSYFL
jgi:hypothetical protein